MIALFFLQNIINFYTLAFLFLSAIPECTAMAYRRIFVVA